MAALDGIEFVTTHMSDVERANAELVLGHFLSWHGDFDPEERYPATFHPDARCRAESNKLSPVQWDMAKWRLGMDEMIAASKKYMAAGMTVKTVIHEVFSRGIMVVLHRTDYVSQPGKPERVIRAVGMFIVINGKVVEWSDFFADRDENGEGAG